MIENQMTEGTKTLEVLAFRVGNQDFGIDVVAVREIRGWTPATPLPHAPSFLCGVVNLRGIVLPIVDLAARLGFSPAEPTARHAIVVTQQGEQVIGLLVDGVSDILTIDLAQVQPTPEVASDMAKSFVRGVIPIDGRMISLLALNTVLPAVNQHAA
ncbi:purine-binding chemotaxis protein CheW [Hyphomicrobium facile]|uniref:Purine-binding chemotaxis protein CheW n=2 Tax=Hyphomicrobium facile TaxID=51670 RepID=A0A1I7NI03_9HYPH|nr:chemotaxis protein CheW [Hyphomicrobium facile]SFV34290.1 purine-binding chemotaxis protein CheW [Hyphomicrobium facile]